MFCSAGVGGLYRIPIASLLDLLHTHTQEMSFLTTFLSIVQIECFAILIIV